MAFYDRAQIRKPDAADHLWRYIDYAKLLDLLINQQLVFVRPDVLVDDPWEGLVSDVSVARRKDSPISHMLENLSVYDHDANRLDWFISCWHANVHETTHMWAYYGSRGVALRTSWSRLIEGLPQDEHFIGGEIAYVDYDAEAVAENVAWAALMSKRVQFASEREVRILTRALENSVWSGSPARGMDWWAMPAADPDGPKTRSVGIDVSAVITEIVVNPHMPTWEIDNLRDLLTRLGYDIPITPSTLGRAPRTGR